MTVDACATCGHGQDRHYAAEGCIGSFGGSLGDGHFTGCPCAAYLPPRPVPEEAELVKCADCGHWNTWHQWQEDATRTDCGGGRCPCKVFQPPATVPAPHAEAEDESYAHNAELVDEYAHNAWLAWKHYAGSAPERQEPVWKNGFIAGYLRGRGDRGC